MRRAGTYARAAGERMRDVREARGLTLLHVEQASDGRFNRNTIGTWERASRDVAVERLTEYAAWLGVSIFLLLPCDGMADLRAKFPQVPAAVLTRWWHDLGAM